MSITFSYRALTTTGTQFDAYHTDGKKEGFNPATTATTKVTATSGNLIDGKLLQNRSYIGVGWPGNNIFPNEAFSILVRRFETTTGSPGGSLFYGQAGMRLCTHEWYLSGGQFIYANVQRNAAANHFSGTIAGTTTVNTLGCHDYVLTCPGTDGSTIACYHNGSLISTATFTTANTWATTTGWENFTNCHPVTGGIASIEEMVVWDEVIDPTNITLVTPAGVTSTAQTLSGPDRTGWVDVSLFEKFSSSDPGVANVKDSTNYIIDGSTLTGTMVNTDPGATNVANGTNYVIESTTYTGSAVVLTAGSGASGTLDINNIKEQIQQILETANTTTASPVDLSANMSAESRIQTIAKYNPDKLPTQVSLYPLVTCWIDEKSIEHATIAKNQRTGKRRAEVDVKVAGLVFNPDFSTADEDPADEDINYLMENIELTLRAFPKLGGGDIISSVPERVTYYRDFLETEQTHVRAGVIDLKVTTYY